MINIKAKKKVIKKKDQKKTGVLYTFNKIAKNLGILNNFYMESSEICIRY